MKTIGIILIVLGSFFLARNFGWVDRDFLREWWPLILIAVGVGLLIQRRRHHRSDTQHRQP